VTSTDEHLNFERCAALHNAILEHGWIDWADAPSHPVWNLWIESWKRGPRGSIHQIPWGLYLDMAGFNHGYAVEDDCRLALPHLVGANGHAAKPMGHCRTPKRVRSSYTSLAETHRCPVMTRSCTWCLTLPSALLRTGGRGGSGESR